MSYDYWKTTEPEDLYDYDPCEEAELAREDELAREESLAQQQDRERNQ